MAITKSSTTLLSAVTVNTTSTTTSTAGDYADEVYVSITITGTPTGASTFVINQTPDGSTSYPGQTFGAPLVAGTYTFGPIMLGATCESMIITWTAPTGGGSTGTCTAQLGRVTGV